MTALATSRYFSRVSYGTGDLDTPARPSSAAVAQVATGFIKADRVKHISPTLFGFMQDLVETGQVTVTKIESANNIANMLTKALPTYKHRELVRAAGMHSLQELDQH